MCNKIKSFELENYGPLSSLAFRKAGQINLIIGENSTGKSTVLKALYSSVRTIENYGRGDNIVSFSNTLADNLRWTFQVDKLGDLVKNRNGGKLRFRIQIDDEQAEYSFSSRTATALKNVSYTGNGQEGNSIYLPAREIFSIHGIILKSREVDRTFGFDNTYYDLAKALQLPLRDGMSGNQKSIIESFNTLLGGTIEYDSGTGKLFYRKGMTNYAINATADGIKKIAMLRRLLENGFLTSDSILFIDEPESSLHPGAIVQFLDIVDFLDNEMGTQVFIASHSYFVIKKLRILAMKRKQPMPCISIESDRVTCSDLAEGMPENSIINESVRLYEEEINEVFG